MSWVDKPPPDPISVVLEQYDAMEKRGCDHCNFCFEYGELREAFISGYAAAQPQWISVKDRLPEIDEEVLAFIFSPIREDFCSVHVCFYDNGQRWRVSNYWEADCDLVEEESVTHWMPLPEPPKEGE